MADSARRLPLTVQTAYADLLARLQDDALIEIGGTPVHQPIPAAVLHRAGVLVNIPEPARYAVHKLIVAIRRTPSAASRATKDIDQAAALIRVLAEDRPDELADAVLEAHRRGPAWRESVDKGARRLPPDARSALAGAVRTPD